MGSRSIGMGRAPRPVSKRGIGSAAVTGQPLPEGCPDGVQIEVRTEAWMQAGMDCAVVLAAGQAQLIVGSRAVTIFTAAPSLETIQKCLEQGERYRGTLGDVSSDLARALVVRA